MDPLVVTAWATVAVAAAFITRAELPGLIRGYVGYASGTEMANDVQVWIRTQSGAGAGWGLYTANMGAMGPTQSRTEFTARPQTAIEQDQMPFPEMLEKLDLAAGEFLVAVSWRHMDGTVGRTGPGEQKL